MASGRTLWDELVRHYSRGVDCVAAMRKHLGRLAPYVDPERYAQVAAFLAIQEKEAQVVARREHRLLPKPVAAAAAGGLRAAGPSLQYYEALCFPYVPGESGSHSPTCKH